MKGDAEGLVNMPLQIKGVKLSISLRQDTEHDRLTLSAFRKGGQYGVDSTLYFTSLMAPSIISLSGAGDFSREALSNYLAGNTASVHLLVDKLRTGVAASAHLGDVETMFQLLWLRWTQPRLDTAVCRMTLDKVKEGYRTQKETPQNRFTRELSWLMSGRNYTNQQLTDSIVEHTVHQEDMLPLHHRFYGSASGYTFVIQAAATFRSATLNSSVARATSPRPRSR